MGKSDEYSDWDEEEGLAGSENDYDEYDDDSGPSNALNEFQKSIFENKVINTFVRNAHEFGGIDTLLEVLNHVERKMGWRTEIIADKNALDDYMFYRHESFDEDLWLHYTNSHQYETLVHNISYLTEKSMCDFVDVYNNGRTIKQVFIYKLRRFVWRIFKNI